MNRNPYKYTGPLDPVSDALVCVPRTREIHQVIEGIMRDEYWAVIGPGQVGKTTFLHLLRHELPNAYPVYFDFKHAKSSEKKFYRQLIKQILDTVPGSKVKDKSLSKHWEGESSTFEFFTFLEGFNAQDEAKKIVLMFDQIDELPFLKTFLQIWRKVYHERFDKERLNRYAVIITGSIGLVEQTTGPTSPFNIAEILNLQNFSLEESVRLIDDPMKNLNIEIPPGARQSLLDQVSGHPQLLQHLCHILTETAINQGRPVTEKDVENAIDVLFRSNSLLDTLRRHINRDDVLANLVREIIAGKARIFHPYKAFSFSGAGVIVDNKNQCSIRNKIFEKYLRDLLA